MSTHYLVPVVQVTWRPLTNRQRHCWVSPRTLRLSNSQLSERAHRQRPAPNGRPGGRYSLGLLPNNASGNVATCSTCPGSKASQLRLCSRVHHSFQNQLKGCTHLTSNPYNPASLPDSYWPGSEVWPSSFLSSILSLSLSWMYIQAILVSMDR